MKNFINTSKQALLILSIPLLIFSCEYQRISDADYPEQLIYLPAAREMPFVIDQPFQADRHNRYMVDSANNEVIIYLAVYRAGVDMDGNVPVDITLTNELISSMLTEGELADSIQVLPAAEYTLPSSVEIESGKDIAQMNLTVSLNFLRGNTNNAYALAFEVNSNVRPRNPDLSTAVILIDAQLFE